tara:strand:- start:3868 stop:6360 length:2493 start_codon:yes stop_codon:yes gene_type:complete
LKLNIFFFSHLLLFSIIFSQNSSWEPNQSKNSPKIGELSGTIIDSLTLDPIPYASISIVSSRNNTIISGGISKEDGVFEIKEIPLGKHLIVFEFIGYEKKIIGPLIFLPYGDNKISHQFPKILMVQKILELGEINVEAEKPIFIQTAEKKTFNIDNNSISSGGSAIDVLRQIPEVEVDMDDNISLRGNSQVNIMIDGKPSAMSGDIKSLLQSISSNNIADIEIMTNPGVKYDPEGLAGIINIKLKENKFSGMNGNFNSSGTSIGGKNFSSQLNLRRDKFNTYVNFGLRDGIRQSSGDSYRIYDFIEYKDILDQKNNNNRNNSSFFLKTGFEYFISPKQNIGISISKNDGNSLNKEDINFIRTYTLYQEYDRFLDNKNNFNGNEFLFQYDRNFTNPKQKLNAFIQFSNGTSDNRFEYWTNPITGFENLFDISEEIDQSLDQNLNSRSDLNIKADYIHPLKNKNTLEIGFDSKFRNFDQNVSAFYFDKISSNYLNDERYSNHFIYDEEIISGYAQISSIFKNINFNLGTRYENVLMESRLVDLNQKINNPYNSFFPSFSFSFGSPQKIQFQASYSKRVNRPRSRQINPFEDRVDEYNIRKGNPYLKPEYSDSYEINIGRYSRGISFNIGPYYRYTSDKISRFKSLNDLGVSTATYANIEKEVSKGISLNLNFTNLLDRKLRLIFSGSLFWDEINTDLFGNNEYDKTSQGQRFRTNVMFNMNETTEFMFFMFYMPKRDIAIGKMGSMSWSALSIKKKLFSKKLDFSVKYGDPFNLTGFHFETYGENWSQISNRDFNSQIFTISLNYRFGKMEDRSRYNSRRNNEQNQNDFEIF